MHSFQYAISDDIFAAHPGYCRGLVLLEDTNNSGPGQAALHWLREAEAGLRERVAGNPAENPRIAAWRDAYRRFGAKPSEHRSSIEAMTRRVLKPDALPSINPLVDIGNTVSLRYMLPVGVHPVHSGNAAFALRRTHAGDVFLPADGAAAEVPSESEIVFASEQAVLTRRWTWRQAAGTQTNKEARTVLFNIDGLPPCTPSEVEQALQDIAAMVAQSCGGKIRFTGILDEKRPSIALRQELSRPEDLRCQR